MEQVRVRVGVREGVGVSALRLMELIALDHSASPLYLPYISPISPLYLRYTSWSSSRSTTTSTSPTLARTG